ncbi:60S acidic ribosomal P1 [Pyrenophora seminiperda CCB06]|uniref:Large ribosomal subunit protein P1 n=1 Tax=Pyrenophora seminiperda CCB06 TaxID=1302712 RepID=A0A3M7LVB5_9PLEO|nr:60S acidic ribosomal P1 [Pyrenophora seminiperda CCB06]
MRWMAGKPKQRGRHRGVSLGLAPMQPSVSLSKKHQLAASTSITLRRNSRLPTSDLTTNLTTTTVTMSNSELATSYAALILADDGVDITADKLQSLIKAAKIEDVEPIWTSLFAKALEGKDVKDLLLNVGSGGGAAPAAGGASGGASGGAEADAPAAEEKKEEEKEESDDDMGFGLFD